MRAPAQNVWLACAAALLAAACSATPPPLWQEGGASLAVAPARWERDGDDIEILASGQILKDGEPYMFVDRAGRIVDEDNDPVAILLPDDHVAGPNNRLLGRMGQTNAAPPDSASAWLSIMPDGRVIYFAYDGDRASGGRWIGCEGPQLRTCTLVTHVVRMQRYRHHRRSEPSFGIGVGIGVGF